MRGIIQRLTSRLQWSLSPKNLCVVCHFGVRSELYILGFVHKIDSTSDFKDAPSHCGAKGAFT